MKNKKYILSISGGGIRGVIPAMFLHELFKRTGKHPTEIFDMFIGTSTGAIISLLYNSPVKYSTEDVVDFYLGADAKKIFKGKAIALPWDTVKYPEKDIESVLQNKLKDYKLKDCIKPCVSVTCDMNSRNVLFLNSTEKQYEDFKMWECARASSAAPMYFKPFLLNGIPTIDGGLADNNPVACGLVEALENMFPDDEIVIVMLGTGSSVTSISYETLCKWSVIDWALNLYPITSDGQSDTAIYITEKLMKKFASKDNMYTFDLKLLSGMDQIGSTDKKFLSSVVTLYKDYVSNQWRDEINRLVSNIN
jgi:patatin-like phospholipase/acyl hydrolase